MKEINERLSTLITRDDLDVIRFDLSMMRKDFNRFMSKDEFDSRFGSMNAEVKKRLNTTPTVG